MIIQSKRVWLDEVWQAKQVEIKDGKITRILPYGLEPVDSDFGDNRIMPGMVDIHAHGYGEGDANHATAEWAKKWAKDLPKEGVTAIVPTSSSCEQESILKSMEIIADVIDEDKYDGAQILGLYSEGPFMSIDYSGGQNPNFQMVPTIEDLDRYCKAGKGHFIYCMVAPEMFKGDMSFIKEAVKRGIVVTCGHTGATFDDITLAKEAGVTCMTHVYNAMSPLHHREPGSVGAAMYYDDLYCELIGDGIHVGKIAGNILARIKGKDKLITVTDSLYFKGLPIGEYHHETEGDVVVTEEGVCRWTNGHLIGSVQRLCDLVKHQIKVAGISETTIINSVTCNPMKLLHFDDRKGYIKVNYDADITVVNDDYQPIQTYCRGIAQL